MLRNKDRYGVWLSTQATVNVLDALVALSPERGAGASGHESAPASRAAETVEVFVNGQRAGALNLPSDERFDAPLALDLSRLIASGQNNPQKWWLTVFPGLTIVAIVLCINFIGDGLRDALDPTQRRIRA